MITVQQYTSEAAMLAAAAGNTIALEDAGWKIVGDTRTDWGRYILFQHDQHPHDIELRYHRNLIDTDRWSGQTNITWWHWPAHGEPTTSVHKLPVDCPLLAAAQTFDGMPMTLCAVIAMCGELDLREVA